MKIKWGALVVDGRGKIGGQVASKNKAGAYLRTKVTPTNPQTVYQTVVRQLFATISQQWSGLTDSVRAGWNSAVTEWATTDIFGDLKQPSGKALFQRLNNQAQSSGYPAVTSAPAKAEMVEGVITSATFTTITGDLNISGLYSGPDARFMLFASGNVSAGTTFVKNKMRNIYNDTGDNYGETDAQDAYIAKFGALSVDDNIYLGVKYVLPNGQASPMQIIKAAVQGI